MKSFVIHMSSSLARRDNAARLLRDLPDARLIEAVDGRDPAEVANVRAHQGDAFRPHYPFALRPAEIGVFQSHRKCWRALLESGEDYALIAEDDLAVTPDLLARALALFRAQGTVDMYARLPVKPREVPGQVLAQEAEMRFILPRVIGLQCICQIVGRQAAARLLAATETIDRPVDTFLQMHWVTGQPVHTILPNGNREIAAQIGGSTIQVKTAAKGKLRRELARALYRAQVALRPQA